MKLLVFLLLFFDVSLADEPIKIVALGDSLTEGYGVERESAYPHLLEEALKKTIEVLETLS